MTHVFLLLLHLWFFLPISFFYELWPRHGFLKASWCWTISLSPGSVYLIRTTVHFHLIQHLPQQPPPQHLHLQYHVWSADAFLLVQHSWKTMANKVCINLPPSPSSKDDEFRCSQSPGTPCIKAHLLCDYHRDCQQGEDEEGCGELALHSLHTSPIWKSEN